MPGAFARSAHSSPHQPKFDYIVVGGGLSGLVVANRLSEAKNGMIAEHFLITVELTVLAVTVIVIENGAIDDRPATSIPYLTNLNTANYYDITSGPEPFMGNKTWQVHVGNVVGGSSVVNGMQWDRGADADYDAWEQLGNPGWGYRGLRKYFKKSTHFHGPSEAIRKHFNITYDASV